MSVSTAPPAAPRSPDLRLESTATLETAPGRVDSQGGFGMPETRSSVDNVPSDPLFLEPAATSVVQGHRHGAVWLAPSPVSFFTTLRYSRRDKLNYQRENVIEMIPPGNEIGFRPDTLGRLGWRPYIHPEGSVYFRAKNFCTNLWLYAEADLEAVERVVDKLRDALAALPQFSSRDIEFGIDLIDDEEDGSKLGDKLGCYYAVDKAKEEAFWLHEVPSAFLCDGANLKIISREHMRCGARMSYWDHVYMFPHDRILPSETLANLRAFVCYLKFDMETSQSSTSPYSSDDAQRCLQALKEVEYSRQGEDVRPEHMVIIGRMLLRLYRERLLRFHGERYAQLDCDQSVFESALQSHSRWFSAISWFLFLMPYNYYERLSHAWVDNKINYNYWSNLICYDLPNDWVASITPSTIILSANVGFLAIQSVDQGGMTSADRTLGQIVSYLSTLLSLGNIAACTILSWQHRQNPHRLGIENGLTYLHERASTRGGFEKLAVIFSIPAALFLWGLLTFFVAIFWVCVHGTSAATWITTSFVAGVTILLLSVIMSNNEWRSLPHFYSLAVKMRRMHQLVKRARAVAVTTGWRPFSMPLSTTATTLVYRWRESRYPRSPVSDTTEAQPTSGAIEMQPTSTIAGIQT